MGTFAERLKRAGEAGRMTTADLSVWFSRPYPTVRGWLEGYEPWGPNGQEAYRLLEILELAIKEKRRFPVPVSFTPKERREYMVRARYEFTNSSRISRTRAAE